MTRGYLDISLFFVDTFTCSYIYSHLPRVGTILTPTSASTDVLAAPSYPQRRGGRPLASPSHASNLVGPSHAPCSHPSRTLLTVTMSELDFDIVDGIWRTAPTRVTPRHLLEGNPISCEAWGIPPWNLRPPTPRPDEDDGPPPQEAPRFQWTETDGVSAQQDTPGPLSPQVWSYSCYICRIVLADRITLGKCHKSVGSELTKST